MYITKKKGLAQIFNLQTEQQVFMALDIVSRSALHVYHFSNICNNAHYDRTNIKQTLSEKCWTSQTTVRQNDEEALACVTIGLLELHEYTTTIVFKFTGPPFVTNI